MGKGIYLKTIITDWLDVTYSPVDTPFETVVQVLLSCGGERVYHDDEDSTWSLGTGKVKLSVHPRFARVSASGGALAHLRSLDFFDQYLSALSESPHNVTRLDAALDVYEDFPPILDRLRSMFPTGKVPFSRKGLKVTTLLELREDGLETGTWYAGHRSDAKITARVYDKANEQRFRKVPVGTFPEAWTRYELTFRREVGCSLKDAHDPYRLFWTVAPTLGLVPPENVPQWHSGCLGPWKYTPVERPAAAKVQRMVEECSALKAIFDAAAQANCSEWVLKLIAREHEKHSSGPRSLGVSTHSKSSAGNY